MTRGRTCFPVTKLMSPEVSKWVTVNVNGNAHHEARILISPYTMRQFENLLSHLTEKLKPPFGAVWRLFTEAGVEIKDLDDIKGGFTYIASGRAKPMFPVRAGLKGSRGRSRREGLGRERELRSHSAVGSLGGGTCADSRGVAGTGKGTALDAASDTNVKQKHALSLSSGRGCSATHPHPSRPAPAPRRGKARNRAGEQSEPAGHVWDQPLHTQQPNHYQQHSPSTKSKQSANKAHHVEEFESDEDTGRVEGISVKSSIKYANQSTLKTTTEGRVPQLTRLKL